MASILCVGGITVLATEVEDADAVEDTAAENVDTAVEDVQEEEASTVDLNGTYNAALGLQTCNTLWISRFGYYDAVENPNFGTDKFAVLTSGSEKDGNLVEYTGTFNDAIIEGNGTYTVSLTDADFAGEVSLSQLHFTTDIPVNDIIKFTDVAVKINGRTVVSFDEGFLENEAKFLQGGMVVLAFNNWRSPLKTLVQEKGLYIEGSGFEALRGDGNDSIEITFTVSGFEYDKLEEVVEPEETELDEPITTDEKVDEETPEVTPEATDTEEEKTDDEDKKLPLGLIIAVPVVIILIVAGLLYIKKKKA